MFKHPELKIAETNKEGSSAEFIRNMRQVASIESLSDEVLRSIFSYLMTRDIHQRVALVSKKWKELSRAQRFGPKCVTLTNEDGYTLDGRMLNVGAVKYFNEVIQSVTLSRCYIRSSEDIESLVDLFKKCANLQKLSICCCVFREDFPIFSNMLSCLKVTLKNIEFRDAHFAHNRFHEGANNNNWYISEVLRFIADSNVDELSLELHEHVEYCYEGEGGEVLPTRLKKLDIQFCISREFVGKLISANKNTLSELKLRSKVFDDEFVAIVKKCENLKYFSLGIGKHAFAYVDCFTRDDEFPLMCELIKLKGLKLEFSSNEDNIRNNNFTFLKNAKYLQLFCVYKPSQPNSNAINDVQLDFPLLTELTLKGDHEFHLRITEDVALNIASNFPRLKILNICEFQRIQYTFGQNALNMFPNLKAVTILKPILDCAGNRVSIDALRMQLANEISSDYSWNVNIIFLDMTFIRFHIERKKSEL